MNYIERNKKVKIILLFLKIYLNGFEYIFKEKV